MNAGQNLTPPMSTGNGRDMYAGEVAMGPIPRPVSNENVIRSISIRQLNHGYIVEVGCQTLAIENAGKLIGLFAEYINNPLAVEKLYSEGKLI